jgi:hypothetical protein
MAQDPVLDSSTSAAPDLDGLKMTADNRPLATEGMKHPVGDDSTDEESGAGPSAREQTSSTLSKFLKGKEREWKAVSDRKRPLTLLELPVDILRLVVKEASFAP